MDLSIILCTWNNASRLRITLDAIAKCEVPEGVHWELVLVNNNCTDDTDAVAEMFSKRLPLTYVHEPAPGLSHARNAGLRTACGDLILFTDDDVRPYTQWIAIYWDAYRRFPEGYYFGGPIESEFEETQPDPAILANAPLSVKGLDWGGEEREVDENQKFLSANWACPRTALDLVGGFDPELGLVGGSKNVSAGEESDLMQRLRLRGWMPRYLPNARLRHFVPADKVSLKHVQARQQAYGYYLATVLRSGEKANSIKLFGIPTGMLYLGCKRLISWAALRVRGDNAIKEYLALVQARAEIRGSFDLWRGRRHSRNRH